jgi:hypothetical protein
MCDGGRRPAWVEASIFWVSASSLRFSMLGFRASLIEAVGGSARCFRRGFSRRASSRAAIRAAIVASWLGTVARTPRGKAALDASSRRDPPLPRVQQHRQRLVRWRC